MIIVFLLQIAVSLPALAVGLSVMVTVVFTVALVLQLLSITLNCTAYVPVLVYCIVPGSSCSDVAGVPLANVH
jgi:uncharacterized membrane-anchored protein